MSTTNLHFGKARVGNNPEFHAIKEALEKAYPELELSFGRVDGEAALHAEHGGMRVFWLFKGSGSVFLPAGYRTKEGDGGALPEDYRPEPMDDRLAEILTILQNAWPALSPDVRSNVAQILSRRKNGAFTGDIAAFIWNLEHISRPWSGNPDVEAALTRLYQIHRDIGYSVKQTSSFEEIVAGDQLTTCGDRQIQVRGNFSYLSIENKQRSDSHISTARRLRHLADTAGGCSFDFQPFRRLPLTWQVDEPGGCRDGANFVNAHVVNIPEELSSTHFHPSKDLRQGGKLQTEIYLVLNPADHGLDNKARRPGILLFPDPRDLSRFERLDLEPGDLVLIPPGVGHRGLDVFVNVLTIPGFIPHNEIYIDSEILGTTGGEAPYNEAGLARRNYEDINDFLV